MTDNYYYTNTNPPLSPLLMSSFVHYDKLDDDLNTNNLLSHDQQLNDDIYCLPPLAHTSTIGSLSDPYDIRDLTQSPYDTSSSVASELTLPSPGEAGYRSSSQDDIIELEPSLVGSPTISDHAIHTVNTTYAMPPYTVDRPSSLTSSSSSLSEGSTTSAAAPPSKRRAPATKTQKPAAKEDRMVARRQKHATSDFLRRQRMKQLLAEMQELASAEVGDQTSVVAAGVDTIKSLQDEVAQLRRQIENVNPTSNGQQYPPRRAMLSYDQYMFNRNTCDIRSLGYSLDALDISLKRCSLDGIIIDVNKAYERISEMKADEIVGHRSHNAMAKKGCGTKGKVYMMDDMHIALFRQLCRLQLGQKQCVVSAAPYYGTPIQPMMTPTYDGTTLGGHTGSMAAKLFASLKGASAPVRVLARQLFTTGRVVESLMAISPVYTGDGQPDHIVFLNIASDRREFMADLTSPGGDMMNDEEPCT